MSNKKNIEFIDKNIEKCKELMNDIENTSDELKGLYDEEEIIKARKEMKEHVIEQIKQFEEIKSILEAWEVVKWSISKEHLEDSQIRTMFGENPFMNITEEEKLIVKKALEVAEDVD